MSFTFTKRKGDATIIDQVRWIILIRDLPQAQLTEAYEAAPPLFGPSSAPGLGMCLIINTGD